MQRRWILWSAVAGFATAIALIAALANFTSPTAAGSFGVLAMFVLIYAATFCASVILLWLALYAIRLLRAPSKTPVATAKQKSRAQKMCSTLLVLNFVPVFLISASSIGQINFVNILLVVVAEAIAIFYVLRRF